MRTADEDTSLRLSRAWCYMLAHNQINVWRICPRRTKTGMQSISYEEDMYGQLP